MKFLIIAAYVIISLILLVLLLLMVRVGFYSDVSYTKADGLKYTGKITWMGGLVQINITRFVKKRAEATTDKAAEQINEQVEDKRRTTNVIGIIKHSAQLVGELKWVPQKVLYFKKFCTWCKVALKDPMKNGITYGLLSGTVMTAAETVICRFNTEEYKVRVTPDFVSNDGISIKNVTWVQLRPLVLIICLVYAYTKSKDLRVEVKEFRESLHTNKEKEERSEVK
ncbi:MAG: hypothetical protein Q8873_08230 [Bacillota bacterium]|nr:hypothetical protein [Bacillota bacterium]